MTTIEYEEFKHELTSRALSAMDDYVKELLNNQRSLGCTTGGAYTLIPHLEAHAAVVAERIAGRDSAEPGSMDLTITGVPE